MLHHVAGLLQKRTFDSFDNTTEIQLPSWTWIVILVDFILFLPLLLLTEYSFKFVYPVFAMIEDENPPAYEPVSLSDPAEDPTNVNKPTSGRPQTVSSSVRSIYRLLRTHGGPFRSNFRGLRIFAMQTILTWALIGIFSAVLGGMFTPIATLLASLTLVQYSTAWVHIVISHPSPLSFWKRIPAFKHTFEATWKAVGLYWFATELVRWVPFLMAFIVDLPLPWVNGRMDDRQEFDPSKVFGWRIVLVLLVTLFTSVFAVIPAHVILVRVQASLLPVDEDPIIPFDKSFQGAVVPAVAGGLGYATVQEAWRTFSKGSWKRLVMLYVKLFGLMLVASAIMSVVFIPEIFIVLKYSDMKEKPH